MWRNKYSDFWTVRCSEHQFHSVFRQSCHKVCNHLLYLLKALLVIDLHILVLNPHSVLPGYLSLLINFAFRLSLIFKTSEIFRRILTYFGYHHYSVSSHHFYPHHPLMGLTLSKVSLKNYRHQKKRILIMETI